HDLSELQLTRQCSYKYVVNTKVESTESRSEPIGGAAVKGNADQRQIQFFCVRDMRQAHERRHTGKSLIDQRVHRHGMRLRTLFRFHTVARNYKALCVWRGHSCLRRGK